MSILKKYLTGFTLTIVFNETISFSTVKINIDYALNYYKNLKNNKHDVVICSPEIVDNAVSFELPTYASALLIIKVNIDDAVYTTLFLNHHMLYKALKQTFACKGCCTNFNGMCQDCNEKSWRTKMLTILLRLLLLEYAYSNNLFKECILYFIDLYRLLCFECITFESIKVEDDTFLPEEPELPELPEDPDTPVTPPPTEKPVFYAGVIQLAESSLSGWSSINEDIIKSLTKYQYSSTTTVECPVDISLVCVAVPATLKAYFVNPLDDSNEVFYSTQFFADNTCWAQNGELTVTVDGTQYYLYGNCFLNNGVLNIRVVR